MTDAANEVPRRQEGDTASGNLIPAATFLPPIDWSAPWFEPWRDPGERVAARIAAGASSHDALNDEADAVPTDRPRIPIRFTDASDLPPGVPYERYVFDSKRSPIRLGCHDFFNGIVWLGMPRTKARLNALQADAIAADPLGAKGGRRGPVRDAITLFDENGAVLVAPDALWDALEARDWRRLFVDLRPLWREARLLVVGHALLEKLVSPWKSLTAHVLRGRIAMNSVVIDDERSTAWRGEIDARITPMLDAASFAAKPFLPLPVMGIPGWSAESDEPSFYDDRQVFRPPRAPVAGSGAGIELPPPGRI